MTGPDQTAITLLDYVGFTATLDSLFAFAELFLPELVTHKGLRFLGSPPIPPAATSDASGFELLRVWIANGRQHVSLATGVWKDPAAWGITLVDLARHVARAYEQADGTELSESLARIREGFDAEWNAPTDEPSGSIDDR